MNKKKFKLILGFAIMIISVALWIYFGVPTFASMGSTGGGGGSTGGGFSGGGGGYSSDSSSSGGSLWDGIKTLFFGSLLLAAYGLILLILSAICSAIKRAIIDSYITFTYRSNFFHRKDLRGMLDLLKQPPKRRDFDRGFRRLRKAGLFRKVDKNEDVQNELQGLKEVYIQSQYLYSQLIRERLVNKHASIRPLKRYLDKHFFYKTMVKEIKLKCDNHEVDDTVVNKVQIMRFGQIGNLYFTQVKAYGQDKEVQFDEDYEASFERSEWSDYVIFGKNRRGQIKIVTLMYGEHAHLNGQDFNSDSSLDQNSKFIEKNHHDTVEEHYRKLNAGKQKKQP